MASSTLRRAVLAGTSILFSVGSASAQDNQGIVTPTILDPITVFGDRQGRKPLDVPANITIIDEEEIDDRAITDMKELVRDEPGVEVVRQTTGTDPFNTFGGFIIRGVGGNRVQTLVDGSRVPERIVDGTRDYLDFSFTKQADIVRGPGSVLWGADALGGIVALETIDPEDILQGRMQGGEVEVAYNSLDDEINTSASYAYQLSPNVSFLGGLSYSHANEVELSNARADGGPFGSCPRNLAFGATPCNELDPTDRDSYRGLAKLVFTPNEDHRVEVSADYLRRDTLVDFNQTLGPVFNFFGTPTGDMVDGYDRNLDLYSGRFAIEHDWYVGTPLIDDIKWSLSYSPNGYERTGIERRTLAGGDSVIEEDFLSFDEDFVELDVQFTSRFDTGALGHTVTWGFDGDVTTTDYQRIDVVRNLTAGTVTERRGGGFNFANATTIRADVYIQDQITLFDERLEITPGVRLAHYNLDPRPDPDYVPVVGSEPMEVTNTELLFAVSADFDITDNLSVYGAYNQGFKMPTAQQLYTSLPGTFFTLIPAPDLRPESVDNYEIGLRGEFDRGFFSINGFYADYTDFIENFFEITPGTFTYRNLSSVELYGIEASAGYDITDALSAAVSLAWQEGTQRANATAPEVPFTAPPFKVVGELSYEIPEHNLTLEAVGTLVSSVSRTSDPDGFKPGGYGLLDLYAKWEPNENAQLRFGVKNVFDERYFEFGAANRSLAVSDRVRRTNPIELQTGPGRTFEFAYKMTF